MTTKEIQLIDRKKTANKLFEIAEQIEQRMGYEKAGPYIAMAMFIRDNDKELPTIDAVPVVRCKDCKYFMQTVLYGIEMNVCRLHGSSIILLTARIVADDWFCAGGERREE